MFAKVGNQRRNATVEHTIQKALALGHQPLLALKKGAIKAEKDGRRFLYSPILKREQWLMSESKGFLDRMFNGRIAPLVAHFSEQKKLSKQDIAELKRLIKELGDDE